MGLDRTKRACSAAGRSNRSKNSAPLSLPIIAGSHDLIAMAPNGTGKTAAYLVPIINKMLDVKLIYGCPLVIILAPIRDFCSANLQRH